MKMRRLSAILVLGVLIGGVVGPAEAAKKAKPKVVWQDETEDAGLDPTGPLPGFSQFGLDLEKGTIVRKGKNLEFTAVHAAMPPTGSFPETFRFLWSFRIGKKEYRLTVKSVDVGKPDVGQGQTTERVGRVDFQGHYRLEGDCGSMPAPAGPLTFINCAPLEYLEGSFDPASGSFTVIVPMKLIKAKPGSKVKPASGDANQICNVQVCWVSHLAERSLSTATLVDTAIMDKSYKIPK